MDSPQRGVSSVPLSQHSWWPTGLHLQPALPWLCLQGCSQQERGGDDAPLSQGCPWSLLTSPGLPCTINKDPDLLEQVKATRMTGELGKREEQLKQLGLVSSKKRK